MRKTNEKKGQKKEDVSVQNMVDLLLFILYSMRRLAYDGYMPSTILIPLLCYMLLSPCNYLFVGLYGIHGSNLKKQRIFTKPPVFH